MVQMLRSKTITARKAHRCELCTGVAVTPGQQYERTTLVNDGHIYDWVECSACATVARRAWDWSARLEEGVDFDACVEWANEAINATDADDRTVAAAYLRRVRGSGMVRLFDREVDTVADLMQMLDGEA